MHTIVLNCYDEMFCNDCPMSVSSQDPKTKEISSHCKIYGKLKPVSEKNLFRNRDCILAENAEKGEKEK